MYFYNMNCLMHIIQEGDTLYSISRRYNVPLSILFKANPYVEVYNLQIGDELCVPVQAPPPPMDFNSYIVQEGDTLEGILERFGINYEDFIQYNSEMENQILGPGVTIQIPMYQ